MTNRLSAKPISVLQDIPGVGTYEWNVVENSLLWSSGLVAIYGLDSAPTDDFDFFACIHPDDRTRIEAETSAFLESGSAYSHRFRIIRPGGEVRLVDDRGVIERNEQGAAILLRGVNFDVTDGQNATLVTGPSGATPETTDIAAERLRLAGGAAGFGFYDFDIKNGRAIWSAELLRIIGRDDHPNSGSMEMALTHVHPDDRDRVRDEMTKSTQRLERYDLEYRIVKPDGDIVWLRDRGEMFGPLDPVSGMAQSASGVLNDITRRKLAESELKTANGVLEALFSSSPIGLGVFDTSFRFLRVNEKLAEMNGLSIADHIGKRPDEILSGIEGLDVLYEQWQRILETGEPWLNVEITGQTPAGPDMMRCWNEHFFPVIQDGEILGIAVLVEDITERKRAEEALEANARQLRRILDGNIGFVGILEPDGTVLEANATALQAGGLDREDVIGRKFWDTYWWNYDDVVAERLKAAVQKAATGASVRYDTTVRMQGGRMITIDFMLSPVVDDDGRLTHLIPSGFDISDRKEALEHVRLLMEEVNHRSKNVLSLVQAIARQTLRTSPQDFLPKFSDRIGALARAQDLLVKSNWQSIDLEQLVRTQLAHFGDALDQRILLSGPPVLISAQAAQNLSMVLHELATNAGKYGALSVPSGSVEISWRVPRDKDGAPMLSLGWQEVGGPKVQEPSELGFGSTLMGSLVEAAFGTSAKVDYAPDGLKWRMEAARGAILETDHPAND